MKPSFLTLSLCLTTVAATALPATADAASLRLRCETRANPARSKISVDGRNVFPDALYTARVISGASQKTSAPASAEGDEVEFDFDSNPADIRAGATAIPATFIKNNAVRAVLFNAGGQIVAGPVSASCKSK